MSNPSSRLVIIVRADPVICGHSGEARNLAEAARARGVDEVRILTWPIEALGAFPLKPLDSVLPYSPGITVERPAPVGDYKVPDGRFCAGLVGRLVELLLDGVPTTVMSLYLTPHADVVARAMEIVRSIRSTDHVTTVAEAVGSDITNVVRTSLDQGRMGAAASVLATYLGNDRCAAVSEYTKQIIVQSAESVDAVLGTTFAVACRERIMISYPAVDATAFTDLDPAYITATLSRRSLRADGYLLFLSRITPAKGVDDLIAGYALSRASAHLPLVVAGTGPARKTAMGLALELGISDRVRFLDDVDDDEKRPLMAGSAAYVLPSKPMPEFVETFGIALVEAMLAGGGPVITTRTGGIPEAVGDHALTIDAGSPACVAAAIDTAVIGIGTAARERRADEARAHAMQFDRLAVFDNLFAGLPLADQAKHTAAAPITAPVAPRVAA